MKRPDFSVQHEWHVAINRANFDQPGATFREWMYDAHRIADETPRLALLFEMERTGKLGAVHQQCSHSDPEPVTDNHLTCCLGVACRSCDALLALDSAKLTPEQIDEAKAWTCVSHILHEAARRGVDMSEGMILTTDDRMYWDRVYMHLSAVDEGGDV